MANYSYYIYTPDALVHLTGPDTWALDSGYSHFSDRVRLDITDNSDNFFTGDVFNDEVGSDTGQTASVYDTAGNLLTSGMVYGEDYYTLAKPGGGTITLQSVEIGGVLIGYIATEPLVEGVTYTQTATGDVKASPTDTRFSYSQPTSVPCFGSGTMIETDEGQIPVDWLVAGDRVLTLDNGYQPIRWIGRIPITSRQMAANPELKPIVLPTGWFGQDGPHNDLVLSPEHRVLLCLPELELHFATHQALAACKFLIDPGLRPPWSAPTLLPFAYYHILLDRHDMVRAEGLWVETLLSAPVAMASLDATSQIQIETALGGGNAVPAMKSARFVMTARECAALRLSDRFAEPWMARTGPWKEGARYGSKSA